MVILHDDAYFESRQPLPDLGPFKNFLRFLWDRKRKSFLDRTAREWAEVGIFYVVFIFTLGAIFAIHLWLSINYAMKLDKPLFKYVSSVRSLHARSFLLFRSPWVSESPGLIYKPDNVLPIRSPTIMVNSSSVLHKPRRYIRALTDFLQDYNRNKSNYDQNCQDEKLRTKRRDKPCFFDVENLGACGKSPYGYAKPLQPCVLIKLNEWFDWIPDYYNPSSELPEKMPDFLRKIVKSSKKFHLWMSCDGANDADKKHIGKIEYIPSPGFHVQFFPFAGQPNYLSPIVALQFKNLTLNKVVTVECILWAFNINRSSRGTLSFQIIISH